MRRIELSVAADLPRRRVEWTRIQDSIRAQWSIMNRRPLSGTVAIGYTWQTRQDPLYSRHMRLWPEIVHASAGCCAEGSNPCVGPCRFVPSEYPQLMVTLEEAS